jgi:cell division protease FtsH
MNQTVKTAIFWAVIVVSAMLLWQVVKNNSDSHSSEISYSHFIDLVVSGQITRVTIAGSVVRGYDAKGTNFRVVAPPDQSAMIETLRQHSVEIWFKEQPSQGSSWMLNLAPLILLALLWFFMIRQIKRANRPGSDNSGMPPASPLSDSRTRFGP